MHFLVARRERRLCAARKPVLHAFIPLTLRKHGITLLKNYSLIIMFTSILTCRESFERQTGTISRAAKYQRLYKLKKEKKKDCPPLPNPFFIGENKSRVIKFHNSNNICTLIKSVSLFLVEITPIFIYLNSTFLKDFCDAANMH